MVLLYQIVQILSNAFFFRFVGVECGQSRSISTTIGAIDDHHLNGVGVDVTGSLLNEVKEELHQVTLPASLSTRVIKLAEQAIWPQEWQLRDENREIPEGTQHKLNDLFQIRN